MYFFSTAAILDFSAFLAAAPTTVNVDSAMTSCVEVKQVSFLSNLNMMMIVQFTKMKPGDSTLTHKHTHTQTCSSKSWASERDPKGTSDKVGAQKSYSAAARASKV